MEFSYTVLKDTVRIDKVLEPESEVVIPENIEGLPVTELAAYALAESPVEELWLPTRLKRIGAYGFYNCERLRRIHCSSRTTDLGAGLFAGTGGIDFVDIKMFEGEKSCLKELLSELRQTLRVWVRVYRKNEDGRYEEGAQARLIFPEYYEESVENTPARILYIETHGCGHRYRYCFSGTQFQYTGYDELFPHVKVQESEELVTELALGRLLYPTGLSERYEKMYREYIKEHWQAAGRLLIRADMEARRESMNLNPGGIPWLVEEILNRGYREGDTGCEAVTENGETRSLLNGHLQSLIWMAQQASDTEAVVWLMDFRHRSASGRESQTEPGTEGQKSYIEPETAGQEEQRKRRKRRFEL